MIRPPRSRPAVSAASGWVRAAPTELVNRPFRPKMSAFWPRQSMRRRCNHYHFCFTGDTAIGPANCSSTSSYSQARKGGSQTCARAYHAKRRVMWA